MNPLGVMPRMQRVNFTEVMYVYGCVGRWLQMGTDKLLRTDLLEGREFQLWELRFGIPGCILLRSPVADGHKTNIDVIFKGSSYIELPRNLGRIRFDDPTPEERDRVKQAIGERGHPRDDVFVLVSGNNRYLVGAAYVMIEENELGLLKPALFERSWNF